MSALSDETLSVLMSTDGYDGLRSLITRELSEAVLDTMGKLNLKYRSILVLRCCERLSHSEIADVMGCSERASRMLFFRAKRSFKRHLSKHGFGKGIWIPALALFAHMTVTAKISSAAVTVTTSSKAGLITAVVTAVAIAIGGAALLRSQVKSIHYVMQTRTSNAISCEQFVYFPQEVDGPVFRKIVQWDPKQTTRLNGWLNNGQGNYMFEWDDAGRQTVYSDNWKIYRRNGRTWRLPSDTPALADFIDNVEGPFAADITHKHHPETELLISESDKRSEIKQRLGRTEGFQSDYSYNTFAEEDFQDPWQEDVNVIDRRDAMHKRGWTYFRITGQINGESIHGLGRIPFYYNTYNEHPPWLKLEIGDRLTIVDDNTAAYVADPQGNVITTYPAGTFFKGLPRPWMGLHTIDIIRRDAAKQKILFLAGDPAEDKKTVTFITDTPDQQIRVTSQAVISVDILEWISFELSDVDGIHRIGQLNFTYLQDLAQPLDDFTAPAAIGEIGATNQNDIGLLWLTKLAQGTLGN